MDMNEEGSTPLAPQWGEIPVRSRGGGTWGHVHNYSWGSDAIQTLSREEFPPEPSGGETRTTQYFETISMQPISPLIRHVAQISEHDTTSTDPVTTIICQPIVTSISKGCVKSHMEVFHVTRQPGTEPESTVRPASAATRKFMSDAFHRSFIVSLLTHGHAIQETGGEIMLTERWKEAHEATVRSVLKQGWVSALREVAGRYKPRRAAESEQEQTGDSGGQGEGQGMGGEGGDGNGKVDADVTFIEFAKPIFEVGQSGGRTVGSDMGRLIRDMVDMVRATADASTDRLGCGGSISCERG